ncbi:MAG: hypothetical protein JRD89_03655 [Deltaproteobacteria bacterium]|nr:hypothetical protein [Deltaproteobacteria bacterium]
MADDIALNLVPASSTGYAVTSDGAFHRLTGTRDGALFTSDWVQAQMMRGNVFCANAGTGTSPITFGAGSIDTTEPDLHISVPANTTILLLELVVHMETYGTSQLFEGMASYGTGGSAGTDTAVTPTNMRSDAPSASSCTVGCASDADATYTTTNVVEFWRFGLQKAFTTATADDDSPAYPCTFVWSHKMAGYMPVLVGASQLQVFAGAQAGTGFIQAKWVELPTNQLIT